MITNSRIGWGDQLGAQLSTLAGLIHIAKETDQQLVFWDELRTYRRGYQFLEVFDVSGVELICRFGNEPKSIIKNYCTCFRGNVSWQKRMKRFYQNRICTYVDRFVYEMIRMRYKDFRIVRKNRDNPQDVPLSDLCNTRHVDLVDGFGIYQEWKKHEKLVRESLHFKKKITEEATQIYHTIKTDKETVAIHFRLTDYLVLASLNLNLEYYKKAIALFKNQDVCWLIFSDDIEKCKEIKLFADHEDVVFVQTHSAGVDMCIMSLCDNNIVANSSFSFWGAFLGREKKKVVCPHDFVSSEADELLHINGRWYPDSWTAI